VAPTAEWRHPTHGIDEPRDNALVEQRLAELRAAATGDANMMPAILDCVRAYATLGEMCDVLREVFGVYQETVVV